MVHLVAAVVVAIVAVDIDDVAIAAAATATTPAPISPHLWLEYELAVDHHWQPVSVGQSEGLVVVQYRV